MKQKENIFWHKTSMYDRECKVGYFKQQKYHSSIFSSPSFDGKVLPYKLKSTKYHQKKNMIQDTFTVEPPYVKVQKIS